MFAEFGHQFVGAELDVAEDFADGVAADDFFDGGGAVVGEGDVDGVGVAEEVVEVAEDFLVGADEEDAEVVFLAVVFVELEGFLDVAEVDEGIDLAVGVAGDVGQHAPAIGFFLQAVNGHHREELLDGPGVGHGLEEGEVAEVGVGELGFELFEIIADVVGLFKDLVDLAADAPEEFFGEGGVFEGEVAEVVEVEGFVALLHGVVVDFLEVFC